MAKKEGKHWKSKKEGFNEFVDFLHHYDDWKDNGIVSYFVHSDYNQFGNDKACTLVSTMTWLVTFFVLYVLNYCLKFIHVFWVVRKLIESIIGIILCCFGFYVAFGKKTDKKRNSLNRINRVDSFWATVIGVLMSVWCIF